MFIFIQLFGHIVKGIWPGGQIHLSVSGVYVGYNFYWHMALYAFGQFSRWGCNQMREINNESKPNQQT